MVSLVQRMLELHKRNPRMPLEQEMVKRAPGKALGIIKIESTDRQIDDLVYELYGVWEEEIKIVESR